VRRALADHKCASARGPVVPRRCAVASQPALWSLREESSWLDRLPVANDGVEARRDDPRRRLVITKSKNKE
jgi:hypothetical protein